ncbi:hypothetical protein PR202_gb29784 [Eleusine coracana subsp. coracana]|uniref:DUF6598 domain-containing protein n=1 Tax=Eleusine coracana subsp. coracana TaxID=191504 RepID=A0AAV5G0I4_ELECO|nr:hypothetical protein PR202_gb29784 [Eleusine coracana subsp. coracana]
MSIQNPCPDVAAELSSFVEEETPSSDVAAELPSFIEEEAEVIRDRMQRNSRRCITPKSTWIKRRHEDLVRNRIILLKSFEKEIMKETNGPDWEEEAFDPKRHWRRRRPIFVTCVRNVVPGNSARASIMVPSRTTDSYLLLTGPSRPVMIIDPVTFEVDLKVKGETESEDKILSLKIFHKRVDDFLNLRHFSSKRSTVEFAFAVDLEAVEATVDSVKIISGSWPGHLRGRVVSRTTNIAQKDVVLLDSRDGRMPIASDGKIELSRSVLSVPVGGELTICVEAFKVGDKSVVEKVNFKQLDAGWSQATCYLGFCEVQINVAWSLFTRNKDMQSRIKAGILSNLAKAHNMLSKDNV